MPSTSARSARARRRRSAASACSRQASRRSASTGSRAPPASTSARIPRPRQRSRSLPRSLPYVPIGTAVASAIAAAGFTPPHNSSVGWLTELVEERGAEALDLHAQTINPQFVRLLRTIGFDRRWARAEGAYLWDSDGNRYLDVLGGFGMFNVGRNNPRVRAALVEALELDTPGSVQLGVSPLPGLLAEALLERAPASLGRVLFTSSGTEAVEAALKLGRAATGRSRVISTDHAFHGLTLGSLSANG